MTKDEWPHYHLIAAQKRYIFIPDANHQAQRFKILADRIDYLEAYGESVNEALGK